MRLIDGEYLNNFLKEQDYDVRKTRNARWIDQKCTPDVLTIISDCILEFLKDKEENFIFTSMDIWHNEYTVQNVSDIFKKPSPKEKSASNEYDKFFQQPMELLSYSGVLIKHKKGNRNFYSLGDKGLLEEISFSERNALKFLVKYITKVLQDSGIYYLFEDFFSLQNKESYEILKNGVTNFTINHTNINKHTEVWRIFIKILNPLAYSKNALGTERGRISRDLITYDMLMYNRDNFRDIYQRKPKGVTRGDHVVPASSRAKYIQYLTDKAMKNVKLINRYYNFGLRKEDSDDELATETHHIFSRSEFPQIAYFLENLINLTPNQHRNHAHPNGNYSVIDREYQKICLIAKLGTIRKSIESNWGDYDFNNFLHVADTGYNTNKFSKIDLFDYDEVINQINII